MQLTRAVRQNARVRPTDAKSKYQMLVTHGMAKCGLKEDWNINHKPQPATRMHLTSWAETDNVRA